MKLIAEVAVAVAKPNAGVGRCIMTWKTSRGVSMRYLTIGMEFGVTFGLLLWGGLWLDGRLGTGVAMTLIGAATGFAAGLYRLVHSAREMQKRDEQQKHGRQE